MKQAVFIIIPMIAAPVTCKILMMSLTFNMKIFGNKYNKNKEAWDFEEG